jgi:fructokinase
MNQILGAIEGGGTKFVCAIASSPQDILDRIEIPTTTPNETLSQVIDFFASRPNISALGVASFGPIDLDTSSINYGHILNTPKAGWRDLDLLGALRSGLSLPVSLNTDVNCAALGEQLYGAGKGAELLAYVTVGTGIGIGLAKDGLILQGMTHTEMGHMLFPDDSPVIGSCPYHARCLEGLASGSALQKRWGVPAEQITDERAWEEEAHYLGIGIANIILALVPHRIVVGGSVASHPGLLPATRSAVLSLLHGYVSLPDITNNVDEYIREPGLGRSSGVTGALALANDIAPVRAR